MTDPIERYLDEVIGEMRGRVPQGYRVVAEIEAHLRDTEQDLVASGVDPLAAQEEAVARFGDPHHVVAGYRESAAPVAGELMRVVWALIGVGMILVGASGVISAGMRMAFGAEFVAGSSAARSFTDQQCRAVAPERTPDESCAEALAAHESKRVVWVRILVGIAGLGITEVNLLGRASRPRSTRVPGEVIHALSTAVLSALAVASGVQAGNRFGFHDAVGAGQWVSLSVAFVIGAVISGRKLWSTMHVDLAV